MIEMHCFGADHIVQGEAASMTGGASKCIAGAVQMFAKDSNIPA